MPLGDALQGLTILVLVVVGSLIIGNLFARIGQPTVLGPISVGLAVGTAVAACPESIRSVLVPGTSRYLLDAVGTAGLLLLMFSVGTELRGFGKTGDPAMGWRLVPCVLVPIAICALATWPFVDRLAKDGSHKVYGWLFVGIALGVTAVPVLVTIVRDLGIGSSPVARAALRIAIGTDGFAWILVTGLIIVTTNLAAVSIPALLAGVALLVGVTVVVPRIVRRVGAAEQSGALVLMMVLAALTGAASTQLLGFHPAIGAVVAGFFFPVPAGLADASHRTLGSVVNVLLPAFFVTTAMSVPLQALREQVSWGGLSCAAVLAMAAFVSKMAAGFIFGTTRQWPWRGSAQLGVLLNCRGVTEIAIASLGIQVGLIGPFTFATLCALAIVTTAVTAPLYRALADEDTRAVSRA